MKFKEGKFLEGRNCIIANEIQYGDIIVLNNQDLFFVNDIDRFFSNDEVAKFYDEDCEVEDILPEHLKVTIYSDEEKCITDIPGTEPVIVYRRFMGKINPSENGTIITISNKAY